MADDFKKKVVEAIEFGNTYPGLGSTGQGGAAGPASPSDLQRRVLGTIQQVLGRTFKEGDHRSFKVALEASFEYKETGGRTSYQWKPRAYPLTGGADIGGGVSGAQFSMVSLATGLYEKTLPLIDGLYSLIPDVDEEQFGAAKAIFKTMWSEFVTELAREGGPRATRIDSLADGIYKEHPFTPPITPPRPPRGGTRRGAGGRAAAAAPALDVENLAKGHLVRFGVLLGMVSSEVSPDDLTTTRLKNDRDVTKLLGLTRRLNFERGKVLTTEEEENLSNYIALTDIYLTVASTWRNYRDTFLGVTQGRDLGTGLLSLERLFAVLEVSVNQVYEAMDSVNIDQAERLVIPIQFADESTLTVEELLSWVTTFASTEGPSLVREGGKWGVAAVHDTATTLEGLTSEFSELLAEAEEEEEEEEEGEGEGEGGQALDDSSEPSPSEQLPDAFKHARVIHPVEEMSRYLGYIRAAAAAITS